MNAVRIPSAPFYTIETPRDQRAIRGPIVRVLNIYPCSTRGQAEQVASWVDGDAVVVSFQPRPRLFREYRVMPNPLKGNR